MAGGLEEEFPRRNGGYVVRRFTDRPGFFLFYDCGQGVVDRRNFRQYGPPCVEEREFDYAPSKAPLRFLKERAFACTYVWGKLLFSFAPLNAMRRLQQDLLEKAVFISLASFTVGGE
ncbi:hypothetical protein MRX96_042945 [Rhipicephalus microplus]